MKKLACVTGLLVILAISGCGYQLRPEPMVSEVRIGRLGNATNEPMLQDELTAALVRELSANGIRVSASARHAIEGAITRLDLRPTAERNDLSIQYEVRLQGSIYLISADGTRRDLQGSNDFIISFGSEATLDRLLSERNRAIDEAMKNLAQSIVSSLMRLQ